MCNNKIIDEYLTCKTCNQEKTLDNFYMNKGYYVYKCKECHKDEYKNKTREIPRLKSKVIIEDGKIRCKVCEEEKLLCNYQKVGGDYYNGICKKCEYQRRKSKKELSEEEKLFKKGFKICKMCKETLPLDKFPSTSSIRFTKSTCKKCIGFKKRNSESYKEYQKKWGKSERGKLIRKEIDERYDKKIIELNRIKKEGNRKQRELIEIEKENNRIERGRVKQLKLEKKKEYHKLMEYYSSDEWKEIKKNRDYNKWKIKWNNDDMFAMKVRLRNLVRNSFRKKGYVKFGVKTEEILGVDFSTFKEYMESKFLDGMSWDNRGKWHIDHIIPLSSATSEDELIKLCHYSNLQPLWAEDNMKKGSKIL